jgi:hypothetical protein
VSVREGQRWKRNLEDGEIIRIKSVQPVDGGKTHVVALREPPEGWQPEFWATPEFI